MKVPERGRDGLGDPDLTTTDGSEYGSKYYKTAEESAKQQAKTVWERYNEYVADCKRNSREPVSFEDYTKNLKNPDKNAPLYESQYRLIPSDQLEKAKAWLERRIDEEFGIRPDQVTRYKDALDKLTDRIKSSDGVESIPLSEAEAKEIAALLREGGFDPGDFGLTTEELIKWQNIMEQAYKAGLSAALISVVLEVAPELINIISGLIKDGKVDENDFKRLGFAALRGGSLGYVRGTVAAALTISCKAGKLGESLKSVDPSIIGAITALAMNAIQNAVLVSFGRMTKHEYANRCIQDLTVTSCAMAFGTAFQAAFGSFLQTLLPQLPVLGFMLGSFVGSAVGSFIYNTAYKCAISYCIESGCTFFGLVEQDYELPLDVLRELGAKVIEYKKVSLEPLEFARIEVKQLTPKPLKPHGIGITVLRRGVIGVNRIGYTSNI